MNLIYSVDRVAPLVTIVFSVSHWSDSQLAPGLAINTLLCLSPLEGWGGVGEGVSLP